MFRSAIYEAQENNTESKILAAVKGAKRFNMGAEPSLYRVGGIVRDELLGRQSKDLDVVAIKEEDGINAGVNLANLVAKEYVVAQDPDNPGVLVLSRFAGAAEQLKEALLVNPYDPQGMADSIQQALQMPLAERQARHQKLMARIQEHDVHWWRKAFMDALQAAAD
jgi:hypothetical protein